MKQNLTKAQTLLKLRNECKGIRVLPVYIVRIKNKEDLSESIIDDIILFAKGSELIVRSSCKNEDTQNSSNAGMFQSILNVKPKREMLLDAISRVYDSYGDFAVGEEEILIQPMLQNIKKSGVIFTSDMDTHADYYIANYYEGNDSSAVTSGSRGELKTYVQYKKNSGHKTDADMLNLIKSCQYIESFLKNSELDIEFAITPEGTIYILQVRPIAQGNKQHYEYVDIEPALRRIYKKASKLAKRHPFLLGRTTCFGVMPDWNPAEILGIRPKKLALSLYKELVTDNIWAHQRYNYGYRNLTMHPLMISFCGIPYIDTRITFNSFIPQNLNEKIAEKLVDFYLSKLAAYPKYHDKIEFEIVYSCYYIGLHDDLKELLQYGFNENEITRIEFSLLELTNNIINPHTGLYKKDIERIAILNENYEKIINSEISLVDKIYWLIEQCKEYGTLPFAGIARAGFIAVQFMKSFVKMGIIGKEEYDSYMNSLDTVNKQMNYDLRSYCHNGMTKEQFLKKYGHIRPGTYDILSKRYDEGFKEYFSIDSYLNDSTPEKEFRFSEAQREQIQLELDQNGLLITTEELLTFIKESIEGREYLKFVFSKSVSSILKLIEELGKRAEIEKEDMAHLDISVVKQLYVDLYSGEIRRIFQENIDNNKGQYENSIRIKLPSIIVDPEDVYSFYLLSEEPNYITQKSVTARIAMIGENDYEGKVVFIQSADPGYDFLFSKNIAGLVTQFGGVNSHMAIRCAELGIPAIIGAGEANYTEWSKCKVVTIDCMKKQVIKIR